MSNRFEDANIERIHIWLVQIPYVNKDFSGLARVHVFGEYGKPMPDDIESQAIESLQCLEPNAKVNGQISIIYEHMAFRRS